MTNKEELKEVISAIVSVFGTSCTERELRRQYFVDNGARIDEEVGRVRGGSLLDFIQNECKGLLTLARDGNDIRIFRRSSEKSKHLDHLTKAGQRNSLPNQYQQHQQVNQQQTSHNYNDPQVGPTTHVMNAIKKNAMWISANIQVLNQPDLLPATAYLVLQQINNSTQSLCGILYRYNLMLQQQSEALCNHWIERLNLNQIRSPQTQSVVAPFQGKMAQFAEKNDSDIVRNHEKEVTPAEQRKQEVAGAERRTLEETPEINPTAPESSPKADSADPSTVALQDEPFIVSARPMPRLKFQDRKTTFEISIIGTDSTSPGSFWFQYDEDKLVSLMTSMQKFYQKEGQTAASKIRINQIQSCINSYVAVKVYDCWHRAEVMSISKDDAKARVLFIDFGTTAEVEITGLRYLLADFAKAPFALRGRLAGVCPICDEKEYSARKVAKTFIDKLINKKLFATIRKYCDVESVYYLDIEDEHGEDVAHQMVLARQAKAAPGNQEFYAVL